MKLEPQNQITLTKEVLGTILNAYGISDFTFKQISTGIANTSAFIEGGSKKYVLRVYAQGKNDDDILFELSFQDYLRTRGIPIPLIHRNTSGEELTSMELGGKHWQVILMDFVEGKSQTVKPSYGLISELAGLQAKMHLLGMAFTKSTNRPKKLWPELRDSLASKIESASIRNQETVGLINRIKAYSYPLSPKLPYGYNHLDLDFDGNVITIDNRVNGIVDFDDLQYSPVIVCLGYSLWNILDEEGVEAMRCYLKEYEKVRPLSPLEYQALPDVIFFRNYAIAMIRLLGNKDIASLLRLEKEIPTLFYR